MDFNEFISLIFVAFLYAYAFGTVLRGLLSLLYYTKDPDDFLRINFKNEWNKCNFFRLDWSY